MHAHATGLLSLLLLTASLGAQEDRIEVPPGREFQQLKVLTLGLTDRWDFDVAADEYVQCVVETQAFDPVLELVDHDGNRLLSDDGAGTRSELRWFAPEAGKVAFRVQGFAGRGGGSYRFWLLRYHTERMAMEAAKEHEFGPERWWHFRVPVQKGQVFVPRVPFGGTLTAVLDLDQERLPEWHGGYTAQHDGDVLLRVEGNERDRCRVDVQLARIGPLSADGELSDELPDGGMHVYRHEFTPGAWTLELDTPDHELDVDFRETAPDRQPRSEWTGKIDKNGRCRQWLLVRQPMAAELMLRNHAGAACYRGRCVRLEQGLQFGTPVEGQLPLGGGCVYELPTRPGQLLRLAVDSSAFDSRFDIWPPGGGGRMGFDDDCRVELNPRATILTRQHGTYRVLVYANAGAGSGAFTLHVDDVPIPELVVGTPLPIDVQKGDAFAHLACTEGQPLWLSVQSSEFDPGLAVFDPDGAQVGMFEGGGVGGDVLTGLRAPKAGVYTLQVVWRGCRGRGVLRAIAP